MGIADVQQKRGKQRLKRTDLLALATILGVCAPFVIGAWIVICALLGWLLPWPTLAPWNIRRAEARVNAKIREALKVNTEDPTTYRVQNRLLGNVRIYVAPSAWNRIPFPDRSETTRAIARAWCDEVPTFEKTWLPRLSLRDIQTGKELDHHSCVWPW